jgi:hypothetical protein
MDFAGQEMFPHFFRDTALPVLRSSGQAPWPVRRPGRHHQHPRAGLACVKARAQPSNRPTRADGLCLSVSIRRGFCCYQPSMTGWLELTDRICSVSFRNSKRYLPPSISFWTLRRRRYSYREPDQAKCQVVSTRRRLVRKAIETLVDNFVMAMQRDAHRTNCFDSLPHCCLHRNGERAPPGR